MDLPSAWAIFHFIFLLLSQYRYNGFDLSVFNVHATVVVTKPPFLAMTLNLHRPHNSVHHTQLVYISSKYFQLGSHICQNSGLGIFGSHIYSKSEYARYLLRKSVLIQRGFFLQ